MWRQHTPRFTRLSAALALALVTAASHTVLTQDQTPLRGVVVEEVGKGSAAGKAGIAPGDILLSWVRAAAPPANPDEARGEIGSSFDFAAVQLEQAPRGAVTFVGVRDGRSFSAVVPPDARAITVRPRLVEPMLAVYEHGRKLIADGKEIDKGIAGWQALAGDAVNAKDWELSAWLFLNIADTLADRREWNRAHLAYQAAMDAATQHPAAVAGILDAAGRAFENQNDTLKADAAFRKALQIREKISQDSLTVASSLARLGAVALARGDVAAAQELHNRALTIRQKLAPGSLAVADSLTAAGLVTRNRGDLAAAEALHRESLAIFEKRAPESLAVATVLNNLGVVARDRSDLAAAEDFFRRSLATKEKLVPGSATVAVTLNNLGRVARDRGDLAAGEELFKRALRLNEKLVPGSLTVAQNLGNLAGVALARGDLAAAEEFITRSLTIQEKLAPDSLDVATNLNNLAAAAFARGDLATAEQLHQRALAIKQARAPDSLTVAASLTNLGAVAELRGDLTAAEELHRRSLAIHEKLAPDSLALATVLTNLGSGAQKGGDLAAAEALHKRSLVIFEKLAPNSLDVAENLTSLGDVARARGDAASAERSYQSALSLRQKLAPASISEGATLYRLGLLARTAARHELAAEYFRRAITALEAQTGRLGGAEDVRSGFAAQYVDYYRDYLDLLVELERPVQALQVLERSRARSLLAMLAERDLVFAGDLPADLARQRILLNGDYDRTQAAIARLNPAKDTAEIGRQVARLRELRDKREQIAQAVRKTSPRFASLVYPEPLDPASVQGSLDPGTVLLAYSVAKGKTFLFVVQPTRPLVRAAPSVSVFTLPIGEAALRGKVSAIRTLIQRGAQSSAPPDALVTAGQELFETLVEPARALIAASDRVLLSPDGPLHTLPFAALVQPSDRTGAARYFIEWKPLHVVASATVYAELKRARRNPGAPSPSVEVAAFGDPAYPPLPAGEVERIADLEVRAAVRRGYALEPLPASRKEVEGIARLYGSRAVTYLGAQATEERAKTIGRGARYVHFASHGLLDERFPLNSALALTIPERPAEGQANGLLQAWEIFEQMRIDADLVTLSACETGLGKELGGEGLVGLTRAFHYAGARSVLASLWSVGDDSTADLMTRFYSHLRSGRTKDDALRAAQLEMIRRRELSHPFHWAAFQLMGDWK
jgi:CHAT domain-containing protein/tetratricopeptide (TPR) repeat protein